MEIIEGQPRDFSALEQVISETWTPTFLHRIDYSQLLYMRAHGYTKDNFAEQWEQGRKFLLAREQEEVVGYLSFCVEKEFVRIPNLYLKPSRQGQGIGKALLDEVVRRSCEMKLKFLELNVNRYNQALYFYRRYGFYILKSMDIPYGNYYLNDYVLRYDL